MRVTVTKNLNVRVGKPSVNAPCYHYLVPGSELEVERHIYNGDIFEGNHRWLKDSNSNFYWSGGFDQEVLNQLIDVSVEYPNWMLDLNIPQIWNYSRGKNVGVAVVDTGIDIQNGQLPYNKINYFTFDDRSFLQDSNGHGTHCAGLIGARNESEKIVGVAPECNLFICKISESNRLSKEDITRYIDVINWCSDQRGIHIISISWGSIIQDRKIIADLQTAVNNAVSKGKVLLCAMGNATQFNDPGPLYPASLENTVGVGSIPIFERNLYPYINKSFITAVDGLNIPSYDRNSQMITRSGTSQSNAIVAGIVALIISRLNLNYHPTEIKNLLLGLSKYESFKDIKIPVLNKDMLLEYFK
jgi:subtilisin family serine protease